MKSFYFTTAVFLMAISVSMGQSFQVTTSSDSVLLGNYIIISFTATDVEGGFESPQFDGMHIISGPNTSSSIQIINGDRSSTQTYSYHVKPKEIGSYTITPAYFVSEDVTLETAPLVINVYPNPENIISNPEGIGNDFFFEFGNISPFGNTTPAFPSTPPLPAKPKRKYKRL